MVGKSLVSVSNNIMMQQHVSVSSGIVSDSGIEFKPPLDIPERSKGYCSQDPRVRRLQRPEVEQTMDIAAEELMRLRLVDVTTELLGVSCEIFTTHEIPAPSQFQHAWHSVDEWYPISQPPISATLADAVLIFSDIQSETHMQRALELVSSLQVHGSTATVVLLSHASKQNEMEAEFQALSFALEAGIDEVVLEELGGMRLVCEVRSRIMSRMSKDEALQEEVHHQRSILQYMDDLTDLINDAVWDYLRVRLDTAIPVIDDSIDSGEPEFIDGFRVGAKLGQGSFGTVCRLMHLSSSKGHTGEVLKMVSKAPMSNFYGISSLKRQIAIMQKLSSERYAHPNIAKLYEVYHSDTHVLFRMEDGGPFDLYKRLKLRDQPLEVGKVGSILQQCMSALAHMHLVAKVAHRDIKPENIIVSETMHDIVIKFADFDAAVASSANHLCKVQIGTHPFMAPEVLLEDSYRPFQSDIWSLGVVFLETISCLGILKKMLALKSVNGRLGRSVEKEVHRRNVTSIKEYFKVPGSARALVERVIRPELQTLLDDSQILIEGMLNVSVEDRWTSDEIETRSKCELAGLQITTHIPA